MLASAPEVYPLHRMHDKSFTSFCWYCQSANDEHAERECGVV